MFSSETCLTPSLDHAILLHVLHACFTSMHQVTSLFFNTYLCTYRFAVWDLQLVISLMEMEARSTLLITHFPGPAMIPTTGQELSILGKGVIEISISNILDLFVISRISNNCKTMLCIRLQTGKTESLLLPLGRIPLTGLQIASGR